MTTSMRYRLLIFDFDGTLADSFPIFLSHMRQVVEHFSLPRLEEHDLDQLRGLGAKEIIRSLGIPYWKLPLIARQMRRLMTVDAAQIRLFPGTSRLLRGLVDGGSLLAIVSSNSKANVRAILGPDVAELISVFECGASLFGKAARFRSVLRQTGVPKAEALAIGDELRDLDAAREAGIAFGAVSWGYTKAVALRASAPEFCFEHLQEVEGAVSKEVGPGSLVSSADRLAP